MKPSSPVLRYHGSKWRMSQWIMRHMPAHRVYVEPFGGGASILMQKQRCTTEIYNDLDVEIVSFFRILRDPAQAAQLAELIGRTPYSRVEYRAAYEPSNDPIEQARRTLIKGWMGINSKGIWGRSGFDTRINEDHHNSRLNTFCALPEIISQFASRLRGVIIENTDALQLISRFTTRETLILADPPYVLSTRSRKTYTHEMSDQQHRLLATALNASPCMVMLCGYPSELYAKLYANWHIFETRSQTDGGRDHKKTIEVLWLNQHAHDALHSDLITKAASA
jgi:DNA adenine methylase